MEFFQGFMLVIFPAIAFPIMIALVLRHNDRTQSKSPQFYDHDDEYEKEQDDLDDDEIDYSVSRGWSAGNGPPPPIL